tara:strand:+ start:2584 stop:2850 length:267 start_codon:yes stop_codon:yes gene_type:complete
MTNEELVALGDDADVLLKTDAFNRTVNNLVDSTFQAFVNSKPEDTDARIASYSHYRAIVDIVSTLQERVSVRDQIHDQAKSGDNNQED